MHYIAYIVSYVIWGIWTSMGEKALPSGLLPPFVWETLIKGLVWIGPLLLLRSKKCSWLIPPGAMRKAPFPWLPTFAGLCLTAAFLHTAHIFLSGIGTWGIFDPMWIWLSLSAAVIEEIAFRGLLFNRQAARGGSVRNGAVNGLLFAIYHFPQFLFGRDFAMLLSLRFWVIAVMGMLFSLAFAKWKNLMMTVVIHFAWNFMCHWFAIA